MKSLSTVGVGLQRGNRWILRDVTVRVSPGTLLALVGPNGSGKSSLLRCMAGLWTPSTGKVLLEGTELRSLRRSEIARHVGYVPQDTRMDFEFSVAETVMMGRYAHQRRFGRQTNEDIQTVRDALERADVAHLANRPVTQLSGGERQRVLIARCLATRARILLLDEPTASLDVDHGLDVLELCRSLADDGHAIAMATHDLNAACRYVDQMAVLDGGSVLGMGKPAEVLTDENLARAFHVRSETLVSRNGTEFLLFHRLS